MSDYTTLKIPEEKIKTLKKALKKRGIKARSNAEAVNFLIDRFILDCNMNNEPTTVNQEQAINL